MILRYATVPWAGCSEPQCGCFRWTWTLKSSSLAKVSKHGPLDRTHRWQITDWNYYSVLKGGSTASAILKALKERIYETLSAWSIASKLTPHPFSALKRHRASATSVILKALNERIWWYKVLYPVSSTHPLIAGKSAQFWNMEKKQSMQFWRKGSYIINDTSQCSNRTHISTCCKGGQWREAQQENQENSIFLKFFWG